MSLETYIARRYFSSGRFFTTVSTWMTIVGVTLGVAVVCIVMSAHNGFESEIRTRLLGTTSHVSVFAHSGFLIENYDEIVDRIEEVDGVVAASPFIFYKAAISSETAGDGIVIRGVDLAREERTANIEGAITAGDYSFESIVTEDNDTIPGILLGSELASRLHVFLGESVVLYSLRGEDLKKHTRPRVAQYHVSGIFETGMYEFDGQLAYISLQSAQDLFRTGDAVTAIHMKLEDVFAADTLAPVVDKALDYGFEVVPWNVLHRNLFSWIEFERMILFLGFVLIILVAAFSIIATLVMLTMEKRAEIGILKTMGTTPGSITAIFVYNGVGIGVIGVFAGWCLAYLVGSLQNTFHFFALPADIYFISYLPVDMHLIDFLATGVVTLLICLLVALYPAFQAARLSVVSVLRE
jgi:lipoprotein-releasing system permease protein